MKLKLVAAIAALAIPALAQGQSSPQKPTKADAQKVVQIITGDKVKTQAYCDLTKLEGQVKAAVQQNDTKTVEMLIKQAEALIDKLGPEYFKLMDGLDKSIRNPVKPRNSCPYFQNLIRDAPSKAFRRRTGSDSHAMRRGGSSATTTASNSPMSISRMSLGDDQRRSYLFADH